MGKRVSSGSRAFNFINTLLAFVLSGVMGVAFVMLVEKTHDLLAATALEGRWQEQAVLGTWQGKWHGVPSVMVTIDRVGNQLTGTIVFQAVLKTEHGPQLTGAPVILVLKEARFDGRTLHFKLDDQRAAREIRESGIEMTLTSANQAELRLATSEHGGAWDYEAVLMTKSA